VREVGQLLLLSVHQQFEIALGQILDVFALLVGDGGVHLYKLRGYPHHFLTRLRGGRRLLRLILSLVGLRLPRELWRRNANNQQDNKNINDRKLISGHGHPGGEGEIFSREKISYAICHISYGIWHTSLHNPYFTLFAVNSCGGLFPPSIVRVTFISSPETVPL
jgi:hypothetical protein